MKYWQISTLWLEFEKITIDDVFARITLSETDPHQR